MEEKPVLDGVLGAVTLILCGVLGLDKTEILPSTRILKLPKFESLDYLDLIHRLKQQLKVSIVNGEMIPKAVIDLLDSGKNRDTEKRFDQYTTQYIAEFVFCCLVIQGEAVAV
jgi:acyl carrier protein